MPVFTAVVVGLIGVCTPALVAPENSGDVNVTICEPTFPTSGNAAAPQIDGMTGAIRVYRP